MAGPHGYVHGWIKVGGVKTPVDSYPPDVEFMKTEDIGKLTSDLEPSKTVEQRYQSKTADATQAQLDKAITKRGWHPSPVEVLNGERLTNGHHTYAAARARGVSHLPVRHYRRAKRVDERGAVRIGGQVTNPGGTERLHEYWVHGEGAAKIRWGTPGDFSRCVDHLGKFIKDPQGYCNLAHHAALGIYPATHAKEIHAGRAAMADTKAKPYGDVKYADPKNGKYPVDTKDHAMAAWSYINMPKNAGMYPMNGVTLSEVKDRIMAACRKFGIDMAGDTASRADDGDSSSGRAESLATFTRSVPFEEISIRSDGDGRVVSAYAAVFDTPAPIHDADGDYIEVLDPAVFNKAISDARPAGNRKSWRIGVFYNHGMTIMGTPSDRYSMPCGKILDVAADGRGLWTEIRYHRSAVGDEVLENIREGTSGGYSFSGRFLRSNPRIPRSGFQKDHRTGELPTVRRTESTLRELGWTPFPAYQEAEVMGTRAQLLAAITADPELATRMLSMFRDGTPPEPPPPPGTPPDEEPPPRSRLVHSGRSVREQIQANTALLLQRQYRR